MLTLKKTMKHTRKRHTELNDNKGKGGPRIHSMHNVIIHFLAENVIINVSNETGILPKYEVNLRDPFW